MRAQYYEHVLGTVACVAIIASCSVIVNRLTLQAYVPEDVATLAGPCLRQRGCSAQPQPVWTTAQQEVSGGIHPAAEAEADVPRRQAAPERAAPLTQTISPSDEIHTVPKPVQPAAVSDSSSSVGVSAAPEATGTESCAPFIRSSFPVAKVPNWGAMHTPDEWNRPYSQMTPEDFVAVPRYDLALLTTPLSVLSALPEGESVSAITAKLFYSTRYFGSYNIDAGEWTGLHAAVDLKLAFGTPVGAIGGGTVAGTGTDEHLGRFVMIRHCTSQGVFYSVYGHFDRILVHADQSVRPGETIGTVGMTGETTAAHVHVAVDREIAGETRHYPYRPRSMPGAAEAKKYSMNPLTFIAQFRAGDNSR